MQRRHCRKNHDSVAAVVIGDATDASPILVGATAHPELADERQLPPFFVTRLAVNESTRHARLDDLQRKTARGSALPSIT